MKFTSTLLFVLLVFGLLQAQTSRKPRTKAAPPTSAAETDQDISKEIMELEETLRRAAIAGDSTWWELHLDDNYIGTDTEGKTSNKAEAIQLHNSPDLKYEEIHLSDMTIRTYNKNTVIISGKSDIDGSYKGQNISGSYHFVRVWIKEASEWKLAASSVTRIPGRAQGSKP